jgi:uncharacterized membrane protein
MQDENQKGYSRDEIKKEFQLERMILFSDAVFAIVITLMAIEIHLPESEHQLTTDELLHQIGHLIPVILAYVVSFFFIGIIWYQHLKLFGLLRDYDKGLVVRNLALLFCVGLFPFSASLITRIKGNLVAMFIYLGIILLCITAQYLLYHYIIVKRPSLRIDTDVSDHLTELHNRKMSLILFATAGILIAITYALIPQPEFKAFSTLWMMIFPISYGLLKKKSTVK